MREKNVRSVLNKKKKRDEWFLDDYTLNPYEGCSINCQYCYVRGSKYGENMEKTLSAKVNSLDILDKQLASRARKNQFGIIALASATDPYLKEEARYRITRGYLEVILKHRFPVLIITKSELILRDLDLLKRIDEQAIHAPDLKVGSGRGAILSFSFSTLDNAIASTLEPGAIAPSRRLEVLRECRKEDLLAGVNLLPVLPLINDSPEQLDFMIGAFSAADASYVLGGGLTLFGENPADCKSLYFEFLKRKFPHLVPAYQKMYAFYHSPSQHYNQQLARDVRTACARYQMTNQLLTALAE